MHTHVCSLASTARDDKADQRLLMEMVLTVVFISYLRCQHLLSGLCASAATDYESCFAVIWQVAASSVQCSKWTVRYF